MFFQLVENNQHHLLASLDGVEWRDQTEKKVKVEDEFGSGKLVVVKLSYIFVLGCYDILTSYNRSLIFGFS